MDTEYETKIYKFYEYITACATCTLSVPTINFKNNNNNNNNKKKKTRKN